MFAWNPTEVASQGDLHLHEDVVCHVVWFCGGQTQFAYVVDHMRKCFVGGDVAYAFVD